MDLIPVSRVELQGRRAAKIEADRQHFIKTTVRSIYNEALRTADTQETTSYKYLVSTRRRPLHSAKTLAGQAVINALPKDTYTSMLFDNATEIIEELRQLFPGCTVKSHFMIQDTKGIWHEESTITEALNPFMTMNCQDVILIDWSVQTPS